MGVLVAGESFFQASQQRGTGPVCGGLREDLEAVGRGQALPPVEQTLPPAFAFRHVLFQNGQDVSSRESQLFRAVSAIVIKCPGQECLGVGGEEDTMVIASANATAPTPLPCGRWSTCAAATYVLSSMPELLSPAVSLIHSYPSLGAQVTCHILREVLPAA